MSSPTWWTWVWASSRNWWWIGKPGMLLSMRSQRVGHDWATELNWMIGGCWQWMTVWVREGSAVLGLVTQSGPTICDPMDCSWPGFSVHADSPGQNTEVDCHVLLQGIFPTQGSNPSGCSVGRFLTIWVTREASWEGKCVWKFCTFCSVFLWIYNCSKK